MIEVLNIDSRLWLLFSECDESLHINLTKILVCTPKLLIFKIDEFRQVRFHPLGSFVSLQNHVEYLIKHALNFLNLKLFKESIIDWWICGIRDRIMTCYFEWKV